MSWIYLTVFGLLACLQSSEPSKILGLFNSPSYSHIILQDSIMQELASRGHEVTVVSDFPPKQPVPDTYRFVHVSLDNKEYKKVVKVWMKQAEEGTLSISSMLSFMITMAEQFELAIQHPDFVKLKNETFDLVVIGWFMNDFQIGVATHFRCPAVIISTAKASSISRKFIGNPGGASYTPSHFMEIKGPMNFMQRMKNFLFSSMEYVANSAFDYFIHQKMYERNFPPDQYPSYDEAKKNVALMLVNQHFSEGVYEAAFPNFIEISGMHIKPPAPLPSDIQEFIDGAQHGAIFFSLGSNVKSAHLSAERRQVFLNVFSTIKERVLWKWEEEDLPNKPDNVLISKWFPQSDILAHPNVKLFISHCGIGSVYEAKYHGVPIMGIPVFADQPANAKMVEKDGWGQSIPLAEIDELSFSRTLTEMLTNNSYKENVKKLSEIYKDRPLSPLDNAAYWVEYVLRYNGAKHLQSPAIYLNFFQFYSLDVIGAYLLCLYILIKLIKWFILAIFRKFKSILKIKND